MANFLRQQQWSASTPTIDDTTPTIPFIRLRVHHTGNESVIGVFFVSYQVSSTTTRTTAVHVISGVRRNPQLLRAYHSANHDNDISTINDMGTHAHQASLAIRWNTWPRDIKASYNGKKFPVFPIGRRPTSPTINAHNAISKITNTKGISMQMTKGISSGMKTS